MKPTCTFRLKNLDNSEKSANFAFMTITLYLQAFYSFAIINKHLF